MIRRKAMLLLFVLPQLAAAQTIDTLALRAHTRFLSSDLLQGRSAGTSGERIAAEYIAAQLMRIGVQPAANGSYFQPVPLKRAIITRAALDFGGVHYRSADFIWNVGSADALRSFAGPVLYVGSADTLAVQRVSEARGHVVAINGLLGAAAQTYLPALQRAGARAVVLLVPDTALFMLLARSRGNSRYFVDAALNDPVWQADLPVVIAGRGLARQLASRERFVKLPGELRADIRITIDDMPAVNVVGIIPGARRQLSGEVLAFSAHYDHLGISTPDLSGDSIYNGFSDNAAGVAMLLVIAELMQRNPPARSVMFLFFTAEERGLLGSSYYAAHPIIPLSRMAGLINLDAGAPPAAPTSWRIAGGTASTLGDVVKAQAAAKKWSADLSAASPNSDYWPFLQRGVPSVFIIPGEQWENLTIEQHGALRARWDRYHRADDEWHPDFPFAGLARYAHLAYLAGRAAADAPVRPTMKPAQ